MLPSLQFSLRTESSSGGTVFAVTCETFSVIVLKNARDSSAIWAVLQLGRD